MPFKPKNPPPVLVGEIVVNEDTAREERFIELYLGEHYGNATKSALGAGYNSKYASAIGSKMLRIPRIKARIDARKHELGMKSRLTGEMILEEYRAIAMANILDYSELNEDGSSRYIDLTKMTREEAAAIAEVSIEDYMEETGEQDDEGRMVTRTVTKTKVKFHPKLPALEALAKFHKIPGIGTTKIELTNPDGSLKQAPTLIVQFIEPKQIEGGK